MLIPSDVLQRNSTRSIYYLEVKKDSNHNKLCFILKYFHIIAVSLLMFFFISCDKDDSIQDSDALEAKTSSQDSEGEYATMGSYIEYEVTNNYGKPNSDYFLFKVLDPSGALALSVKVFDRTTGVINYYSMSRIGSNWQISMQMLSSGWYDYRYVYSSTKGNISGNAYVLSVTNNILNTSGYSKISWPFGADGSSYNNRLQWIGSHEAGGCGYDWGVGTHTYMNCQVDDYYAEDWNKNCSSSYADDGAIVRSPLDGQVVSKNGIGYGYSVDIKQSRSDSTDFVVRIGHLKYNPSVSVGDWVKAGVTKIGNVGMTGNASSPHAHIVLYKQSSCNTGLKFILNAM